MSGINDLNLVDEEAPQDNIAQEELGRQQSASFSPPPQPGRTYRFKLPDDVSDVFSTVDTKNGQRIRATFREERSLSNLTTGKTTEASLSTVEQKDFSSGKLGSQLSFLLVALGESVVPAFGNSRAYIEKLAAKAGAEFKADVDWDAFCNPKKPIYVFDEAQGKNIKNEAKMGCGRSYKTRSYPSKSAIDGKVHLIPQVDGEWQDKFVCACDASLRINTNLVNFRAAK